MTSPPTARPPASAGRRSHPSSPLPGALVISLDFELHWGVRDIHGPTGAYAPRLHGARDAVRDLLAVFAEYDVACTWATVGFLFARSRAELEGWRPARRPQYRDERLDPYVQPIGEGEGDDPLHYAPTLIAAVAATPRQEIGTHTFSHYYCLEPGQDVDTFAADLGAARAAAAAHGVQLRSLVFPRNQVNPAYAHELRRAGIVAYRGTPRGWAHRARAESRTRLMHRVARTLDVIAPVGSSHTFAWDSVRRDDGLHDVPASFFLRPYAPRMPALAVSQQRRLVRALEDAAHRRRLLHVWWHPHNFGGERAQNIEGLRRVLDAFAALRDREGMVSLSMGEVADRAASLP